MAFIGLADLVATIEDYLERADLDMRIPTFLRLAEVRLDRRLNLAENEATVDLPLVSGASPLPDDYRAWRALTGPCGESFDFLSPHVFTETFRGRRQPDFGGGAFTILGSVSFEDIEGSLESWTFGLGNPFVHVAPIPTGSVRLVYRQGIPPLSEDRPSNWLLERHPDLYLYAALMEAAPFLRNDSRISTWSGMLEAALSDLADLDRDARWGRARMHASEPTP
jgi:hypothetical protein